MWALAIMILGAAIAPPIAAGAASPMPAPVIDNAEVSVVDLALAPGVAGPPTPADADVVILFLAPARIRTLTPDGTAKLIVRHFGDAVFVPRGTGAIDTAVGTAAREMVVTLKAIPAPLPNTSNLPLAFPRAGSVKVLETPHAIVWRYSWKPGKPTPMHYHNKDVVLAYRYDGTLNSTTPDGMVTVNAYKAGDIRFNKADRTHTETLVTPRQSAVILELK